MVVAGGRVVRLHLKGVLQGAKTLTEGIPSASTHRSSLCSCSPSLKRNPTFLPLGLSGLWHLECKVGRAEGGGAGVEYGEAPWGLVSHSTDF